MTDRDKNANTLIAALNCADARTDAPARLPSAPPDMGMAPTPVAPAAQATSPLSHNQQCFLALATACKLGVADDPSTHAATWTAHQAVKDQQQAANYIATLENQIVDQRL
jgi:hypothetical protein